jgi:hypothetical protein
MAERERRAAIPAQINRIEAGPENMTNMPRAIRRE